MYTLIKNDCDFSFSLSSHLTKFINWKRRWGHGGFDISPLLELGQRKSVILSLNDRKLPMRIVCISIFLFFFLSQITKIKVQGRKELPASNKLANSSTIRSPFQRKSSFSLSSRRGLCLPLCFSL